MKIDKRGEKVVYIEIDGMTFYIDHSTGEAIMEKWVTDHPYKLSTDPSCTMNNVELPEEAEGEGFIEDEIVRERQGEGR